MEENRIYMDIRFKGDTEFNQIYPPEVRTLAARHWTPLSVARKAAEFLAVGKGCRVLDIGSGVGKFCLAAGYYRPDAFFFGVEQRKNLVEQAEIAKEVLNLNNVGFVHGNFTQLDFDRYDHFYFYNSFYENLSWAEKIDDALEYSPSLFRYYNRNLYKMLASRPEGTRLVTYHSLEDEIPREYQLVGLQLDGLLKFWIKVNESLLG